MDYQGRTSSTAMDEERLMDEESDANARPVSSVLQDIRVNIQEIVRSEVKLAKIELSDTVVRVRSASTMLGGGSVLGVYAIGFFLLTAMLALDIVLPSWLSALIVGILALAGAAIGLSKGRQVLKTIRPPEKTIQTVKEDLLWTKEQVKS